MGTVTHTFVSPVADAGNPNEVGPSEWNASHTITGTFPGEATISDTAPGSPNAGQLWWESDTGIMYVYYTDADSSQWVQTAGASAGSLVQMVSTQTGAVATGTVIIPIDDTIPQITEGVEFMTVSITPKATTNKLIIEAILVTCSTAGAIVTLALFQDSTANALAASADTYAAVNFNMTTPLRHTMTAGTTSATTLRLRAGLDRVGTLTVNGAASARQLGGVMASSITVTEIAA